MKRRDFIVGLLGGAAVASPLAGQAQSDGKALRIGFLTRKTDASVSAQIDAFRRGLRDLGWLEGKSINIEYRNADGNLERLLPLAAELVGFLFRREVGKVFQSCRQPGSRGWIGEAVPCVDRLAEIFRRIIGKPYLTRIILPH